MIDKNKKLMLVIVDPMGNSDINYFEDFPDNLHYKIFRSYIHNKSMGISLKYDLDRADARVKLQTETEKTNAIESNLYELIKIFTKNGYLLLLDSTDYRQYSDGNKHHGQIILPTPLENLSEVHKKILESLSNELIVDNVCSYKNSNKLVFYQLPIFYYDKYSKKLNETGQQLDEVLFYLKNKTENEPKNLK